ncbi:MAG: hypothetical protein B6D59_05715 [Campylobacteraceae bacterium 4484_4]|nr:MAG: hypothetical protein B6D59_05715 [Campylobacteraceae bacterium 4484_4]
MAKLFIGIGLFFILIGVAIMIGQHFHIPFGRLPGDIVVERENFTFYFPITTMILLSILLSVLFNLFGR